MVQHGLILEMFRGLCKIVIYRSRHPDISPRDVLSYMLLCSPQFVCIHSAEGYSLGINSLQVTTSNYNIILPLMCIWHTNGI
jgi:hypothetical protein